MLTYIDSLVRIRLIEFTIITTITTITTITIINIKTFTNSY